MARETERVEEERRLRRLARLRPEASVLEEEVHDRPAEHDHHDRRRERQEEDPADRLLHRVAHPAHLAQRSEVRERREYRGADRDREDAEWEQEQLVRVDKRGQGSWRHACGEIRVDEEHDLDRAQRERARTGQAHDVANAGMRQVQRERVAGATEGELGKLDEPHHQGADDDADRDRVDTEEGISELGEQDDHEVVDKRGCRAREELPVGIQDARRERRQAHEDRRQQHDPREIDREGDLLGVVERRDEGRHHIGRGDPHHDREAHEEEQDGVHDARRDVPRFVLALAGQVAREDRDESRRKSAGDHEPKDRVRDLECRQVRVQIGRLPEVRADDGQPEPAEYAAGNEGDDHDRGGPRDRHRQPPDIEASGIVRT